MAIGSSVRPPFKLELMTGGGYAVDAKSRGYLVADSPTEAVFGVGQIRAKLCKRSGTLEVEVPFTTADQLYYRRSPGALHVSNDLRALFSATDEPDPRGFYALLQFGATIPPATLWKELGEFIPGRRVSVSADDWSDRGTTVSWPDAEATDPDLPTQMRRLSELIDHILIEACPEGDPIILFSGGVDSGVLAARASALGWKGTTLVNYSFGDSDRQSALAETMAKQLGLGFMRIGERDYDSLAVLDDIGAIFQRPFGDPSLLPTHGLTRAVVERFTPGRVVFDGTGADGAFALFTKASFYRNLYRVPGVLRRTVGHAYRAARCFTSISPVERVGRIVRRSAYMPAALAAIARNPLSNVAYRVPSNIEREVLETADSWIDASIPDSSLDLKLPAADLAMNCSRVLAQKTKSMCDAHGHRVVYPFLDGRMVGLALRCAQHWPGAAEPKRVLKAILASHVSADMVYRPKSAFIGPYRRIFARPAFAGVLQRLLGHDTPLSAFIDRDVVKILGAKMQAGSELPAQTYWFVWTAVFAHLWLEQLNSRQDVPDGRPTRVSQCA